MLNAHSSMTCFMLFFTSSPLKGRNLKKSYYSLFSRVFLIPVYSSYFHLYLVLQKLWQMAKLGGIVFCLVVVSVDVVAGILGLQAEIAQNKVKHLRLWIFECREPSEDAFKLGLAAAALLVIAHVVANLIGGCMCICSQDELQRSSPNKQLSVACFFFTWIILAVGLSMLVIGTLANHKSRTSCGFTHHHFLSIGGILCFVHALFSIAYYVSATSALSEEHKYGA